MKDEPKGGVSAWWVFLLVLISLGTYDLHLRTREALVERKIHRLLLVVEDHEHRESCLRFELLAAGVDIEFNRRELVKTRKRAEELLDQCLGVKQRPLEDYVVGEEGWEWERGYWGGPPPKRKGNAPKAWPENIP